MTFEEMYKRAQFKEDLKIFAEITAIIGIILIVLFLLIITINIIVIRRRMKKTINLLTYEMKSQNILLSEIRDQTKQQPPQPPKNWNNRQM